LGTEKLSAQIAFTRIGQDDDHGFTLTQAFGHPEGSFVIALSFLFRGLPYQIG
jgi:hypothetical protein